VKCIRVPGESGGSVAVGVGAVMVVVVVTTGGMIQVVSANGTVAVELGGIDVDVEGEAGNTRFIFEAGAVELTETVAVEVAVPFIDMGQNEG